MLKLALALGQPLSQIRSMSSHDLALFMAYDRISPIGPERIDAGLAIQTSVIANSHRAKNSTPFKPEQFMPWLPKKEQTLDEMKAILMGMSKSKG